jgi:ubiquinone/menaquinone biosynthesis C-methylase UbiE
MTATQIQSQPGLASRLINTILAIKPLANFAKQQAREMMIKRAEKIGVPWRENVKKLRFYDWENERAKLENPNLKYPDYYLCSFHAYEKGNLNWDAALEVESAAYAVHATIWQSTEGISINGDPKLRASYHKLLQKNLSIQPQNILDIGCSVGMSTFALKEIYPEGKMTGLDLSPHFLAVANYRSRERNYNINWLHAGAEATGLPEASFDLVSCFLMFHELPQKAAREIFAEVRRILRPGGYFTMMDMNPQSPVYRQMPPYILTLLKSTEPYLDQYFTLDIKQALIAAGFEEVTIIPNSPRHRTIIAQAGQ